MTKTVSPFSHDRTIESIPHFKALLCKEWFENVHRYETVERSHRIQITEEYIIRSLDIYDCLILTQRIGSVERDLDNIKDISTDNGFLTILLDRGIRIQVPIEKSVKTISYLKVNKASNLCGGKQKNELSSFDVFGLQVLQRDGNSPSLIDKFIRAISITKYSRKHEVPGVQFLRRSTPKNLQGLSPLSSASLNLNTQSSTPCDKLANSLVSTFDSRYSINSGGKAIVNDFLRIVLDINAKSLRLIINTRMQIALLSCNLHDGVLQYDKNNSISESYGSVHSSAGKDSIQRNNSRDSLHRGLSFGYVHRRTEIDHRRQSESGNNNIHRSDIQIGNREEACA